MTFHFHFYLSEKGTVAPWSTDTRGQTDRGPNKETEGEYILRVRDSTKHHGDGPVSRIVRTSHEGEVPGRVPDRVSPFFDYKFTVNTPSLPPYFCG